MTMREIEQRHSRRKYTAEPLTEDEKTALSALAQELNRRSGLSIRLMTDIERPAILGFTSYGRFANVRNYFLMAGEKGVPDFDRRVGYFGEELVLKATGMGLGTCWLGIGLRKKDIIIDGKEHMIRTAIIIGHVDGDRDKTLFTLPKRPIESLFTADSEPPKEFFEGMRAVSLAPSALNRQPVRFRFENGKAFAWVEKPESYQSIDLGIAMLHFEIGCGGKIEVSVKER